jgi:hypothetical protein
VLIVIACRLLVSVDGVRMRGSYILIGKQLKAASSRIFQIESSS